MIYILILLFFIITTEIVIIKIIEALENALIFVEYNSLR